MHGIQHLFRQQAVEKQSSTDSWHSSSASFTQPPYTNGRVISNDSTTDLKPPIWSQGLWIDFSLLQFIWCATQCLLTDRVLEHLQSPTFPTSPQNVPPSLKSPTQENYSSGSNGSSSCRWKRSSPDPNKMMMGRSPIVIDNNAKRILSTTPSRRASNHAERVGSPCLSGYPVRKSTCSNLSWH